MDKTSIAVKVFGKCAGVYEDKYMDVSLYAQGLDLFCESIHGPNPAVLELACGPGNITRYLLSKRPDFRILATDLSPEMLALATKNNPAVEFRLLDCRAVATLPEKYHGVVAGFCLPYLSKEETGGLINSVASVLHGGGIFYLSTMEGSYSSSGWHTSSAGDSIYIYYHEAANLQAALEDSGFQIVDVQRVITTSPAGQTVTDLVIIAKKVLAE